MAIPDEAWQFNRDLQFVLEDGTKRRKIVPAGRWEVTRHSPSESPDGETSICTLSQGNSEQITDGYRVSGDKLDAYGSAGDAIRLFPPAPK